MLTEHGGADVILATAPNAAAIGSVVSGLAPEGELLLVGAPEAPLEIEVPPMLDNRWSIRGWSAGHPGAAADTLAVAAAQGIEPWTETYPLASFETAVGAIETGDARFRAVVTP